jgi:hypothetical protein
LRKLDEASIVEGGLWPNPQPCELGAGLVFCLPQRHRFLLGPDARLHAEPFRLAREGRALLWRHAEPVGRRLLVEERDLEMLFRREDHEASIAAPL